MRSSPEPHSPSFGLSPSVVARYFFHDCERFLRFRATRRPTQNGVPSRAVESGPVTRAVLASGRDWEEQVLTDHLANRALIAEGDGKLSDRVWSIEESLERLRQAQPGQFLYQLTLRAPPSLYSEFNLDPKLVEIVDNRPDLVEVASDGAGGRRFRVIDMKRGASVRLPYRIQVLFYALELEHILRVHRVSGSVDLDTGAAWLGGSPEPEDFDLRVIRPHLEDLLMRLPALLGKPPGEAEWHVRFRCEWCDYLDHCQSEMVATNSVSRLAGLTTHGKRFLARALAVHTLPDLASALDHSDADAQLQRCASLAGERPRLEARIAAYKEAAPHAVGGIHPALPVGESVAIFLTAQTEPVEDRTWLLGMLVRARKDLRRQLFHEQGPSRPFVAIASKREECLDVRTRFIRRLHEVLRRVDLWNSGQSEWRDQLSIQLYCYSEQERERLVRVLIESLHDPALSLLAMSLLFHLQAPEMLLADDHPEEVVPHPVIPLVSAVGSLLALPVDVSYTLSETLDALGSSFAVSRSERFHYPFGHGVRPDDVYRAWNGADIDLQAVVREAARRLYAYRQVLSRLRTLFGGQLVAWPPKHRLLPSAGITSPRLSRLAFLARYESVMQCLAVRAERFEARASLAARGVLRPMVYEGGNWFRVTAAGLEIEASGFNRWLIVRDSPAGLRAQARFNDWAHRARPSLGGSDPDFGVGRVIEVNESPLGFARGVRIDWTRQPDPPLEEQARVLLMPGFLDFNTDRVLEGLARLDQRGGMFVELLQDPASAAVLPQLGDGILAGDSSVFGLTQSQAEAWDTVAASRVTSVWGPPGTGKTHFLAALVLGFCEAPPTALPGHVLITAMTHAAIDNLLRKVVQLARALDRPVPAMAKVGGTKSDSEGDIEAIDTATAYGWLRDHPVAVLGSTVWGLAKSKDKFDLVVIDEASQVKVPDAALAIERIGDRGRLVAAGDHHQLGPILAGVYPDPPDGEPILHGSIFDLLRDGRGWEGAPVCQLLENWRMCDVLTRAARPLYGAGYQCASAEIAARRLGLRQRRRAFTGTCIAPGTPLVVVILEGVEATNFNAIEADLVSQLAVALREDMADPGDDSTFWRERLFIVSPHHAQISAIRKALARRRDWSAQPFVGTVDKMQG